MKTTIRFPRRLCLLLMAVLILGSLCLSAAAAEVDHTYGLRLELTFSEVDGETVEHTQFDYNACAFLIQDSSSQYLIAALDTETGIYHITGTVADKETATRFRGGHGNNPALLQIDGLTEGSYTLTEEEVTVGYILCPDPTSVQFSDGGAVCNDTPRELENGVLSLTVDIPNGYYNPFRPLSWLEVYWPLLLGSIAGVGLLIMLPYCIIRTVKEKKEKSVGL